MGMLEKMECSEDWFETEKCLNGITSSHEIVFSFQDLELLWIENVTRVSSRIENIPIVLSMCMIPEDISFFHYLILF